MAGETVTAALLVIGNEILSGRTRDANLPYIATALNDIGVRLREARVVADIEDEIVAAVNALRTRYDYLFTTGGIGPTHDDITAASIARAVGQRLIQNPEALSRLRRHYAEAGLELTAARLRMANTPENATLIDNPISTAPGFRVENVFVLPGVPKIMQAMLDGLKSQLSGGRPLLTRSVVTNLGEGTIAAGLTDLQLRFPDVEIGSYPRFSSGLGGFRVTLVLRHTDAARLAQVAEALGSMIQDLGGEFRLDD